MTGAGGGGPIEGARVCAHPATSSFNTFCANTNSSGEYTIASVPGGSYRVDFEGKGEYLGQWFDGKASEIEAELVAVAEGAITAGIDAELVVGAAVEGVITDATSGDGLANINACAEAADGNPYSFGCATTEADGHYRLVGIPTGEYKLRFEPKYGVGNPDYPTQYYPDVPNLGEGSTIHLTDGSTATGIDTAMHLGGTISGTVVNQADEPVKGVLVCTYPAVGKGSFANCFGHRAETASDGTYTLHGIPSGEYKVDFFRGPANYLPQFYPDQKTRAGGTAITVSAPEAVTGIDATVQSGGTISGLVVEGHHFALGYAQVCASGVGGGGVYCAQSKSDGTYSINSLPSGEYLVEFASPNSGVDWPYIPTFYGQVTERANATPVHVSAGSETSGIGAVVEKGGTISGQITDSISHEPAEGIYVCAYSGGEVVGHCDTTHASGDYTIIGLPSGSYAVRAAPAGGGVEQDFLIGDKHYMSRFYEEAASEATATPVASGPGIEPTGIDIAMQEGGGISGTVTGPLSEPLPNVEACIVESAEDLGEHCAATDAHGEYEIAGLYPGIYDVYFWPSGSQQHELTPQYFHGVLNFDEAEPVTVTGTAVTPGIDAQLAAGGTIEGTVTDAYDGSPIAEAWVCAEKTAGTGSACVESEADGAYSMAVAAGSYRVEFSYGYYEETEDSEVEEFVTQYFDGAGAPGTATSVTVGSGVTRTGVDAALVPAAARLDTVSIARLGSGSGTITSAPAGIDCGSTCTAGLETRKTVTLHAEPASGSTFTGWTGACSGTGACQIRLTGPVSVSATFESNGESGTGTGGGSGSGSGEGGTGGSTTPPTPVTSPEPKPTTSPPKPQVKKVICKKGYTAKKFGKIKKCVKKHQAHRAKQH